MFAPVVRKRMLPLAYCMHDAPNGRGWIDRLSEPDASGHGPVQQRLHGELGAMVLSFGAEAGGAAARCAHAHGQKPGARADLRAALDVRPDTVVILQVSRMQALKGQRLLIDALARLDRDRPWVCWIAGGAQRPEEVTYERDLRVEAERSRPGISRQVPGPARRRTRSDACGRRVLSAEPRARDLRTRVRRSARLWAAGGDDPDGGASRSSMSRAGAW